MSKFSLNRLINMKEYTYEKKYDKETKPITKTA